MENAMSDNHRVYILVAHGRKDDADAFGDIISGTPEVADPTTTWSHVEEEAVEGREEPTVVIFRKWKYDDEIIAVFPEIPARSSDWYLYQSYSHHGQHSAANPQVILTKTRPAGEEEYAKLKRELERMGYKLIVRKRETQAMRKAREDEWKSWTNAGDNNT